MKKIRIKESELVELIEKLVKENIGNGNGQNFGLMGTPTAKYKDLLEKKDIEEDDVTDNEEEVSEDTLNINVDDETQDGLNQEDYMESVKESRLISRIKKNLLEKEDTIDIKKKNKGNFTKWVEKNMKGVSVCDAADKVMSDTKKYESDVVQMANFAKNFGCKGK